MCSIGDHLHCCPNGYTCDVEHGRCQKGFDADSAVVCPGGEREGRSSKRWVLLRMIVDGTTCADGTNERVGREGEELSCRGNVL